MLRSVAITRINDGLGFRAAGNELESKIVLRLQEAQRDLERGKTLPRFLLQENQTLSLLSGASTAALPAGFLRESDENRLHYFGAASSRAIFLSRRYYIDAVDAQLNDDVELPVAPTVYVMRKTTIDFITTANANYTLYWDYYKAADILASDIENAWLAGAPEWLIGEAGYRLAMDVRDADAVTLFNSMRTAGRAACLGDDVAFELAAGPIQIGANR